MYIDRFVNLDVHMNFKLYFCFCFPLPEMGGNTTFLAASSSTSSIRRKMKVLKLVLGHSAKEGAVYSADSLGSWELLAEW